MCAADIIVVDKSEASLKLAEKSGADHLVKADGNEVAAVLALTAGNGAEAVIDFVGEKGTTSKGLAMTRPMGSYYVVGTVRTFASRPSTSQSAMLRFISRRSGLGALSQPIAADCSACPHRVSRI
jgi:threonine dehydrogenase-like Zn-dependent dehydrogenase